MYDVRYGRSFCELALGEFSNRRERGEIECFRIGGMLDMVDKSYEEYEEQDTTQTPFLA